MNTDRLARTAIMSCLIIGVMLLLTAGILLHDYETGVSLLGSGMNSQ